MLECMIKYLVEVIVAGSEGGSGKGLVVCCQHLVNEGIWKYEKGMHECHT